MCNRDREIFAHARRFVQRIPPARPAAQQRPEVTLTFAQSLDGKIARPGEPLLLSGRESMAMTHRLRAAHDAIMVGINTVICDNPQLSARLLPAAELPAHPQPVVLDAHLRIPLSARLLTGPQDDPRLRPPWIVTAAGHDPQRRRELEALGARVIAVPADSASGRLCLDAVLAELRAQGVQRLMVEGGARVIQAFLTAQCVDSLIITISPSVVGPSGVPALSLLRSLWLPALLLRLLHPVDTALSSPRLSTLLRHPMVLLHLAKRPRDSAPVLAMIRATQATMALDILVRARVTAMGMGEDNQGGYQAGGAPDESASEVASASEDAPSDLPTDIPSGLPTDIPSGIPDVSDILPSGIPSEIPDMSDILPTDIPTDLPSGAPSEPASEPAPGESSGVASEVVSNTPSDSASDVASDAPSESVPSAPSEASSAEPSYSASDVPSAPPVSSEPEESAETGALEASEDESEGSESEESEESENAESEESEESEDAESEESEDSESEGSEESESDESAEVESSSEAAPVAPGYSAF
ncbi:2,5-diamino-6-(ribosylamino)-4(3H)-pyrimidinone 5'-phosphate reductase [Coemansia sp. RSA 552]|nr:2,5-diamino-6-(ribosylamino)-4(3H)-pyrimidinone 5'-phosphate reductase [Coemansia sp. RSA 552]